MTVDKIRPTKKQRELLSFIEKFIVAHGYSPSYREIMDGTGYTSVATVALHVNNLINRGHLSKRGRSARSLEIVNTSLPNKLATNQITEAQEKWLVEKVDYFFTSAESAVNLPQPKLDELYVLIGSLKVLGLGGAAQSFMPRLAKLKKVGK